MRALPASQLTKLAGILGLLASDHDGEVIAAGRAATRHLRAAGVTWHDILLPAQQPRGSLSMAPAWRDMAARCARHGRQLTASEARFIGDIRCGGRRHLTVRQVAWLERIAARLAATGGAQP